WTVRARGSAPPENAGMVLTTAAPRSRARTQGPSLLNRASVPAGLRAPTATIGTASGSRSGSGSTSPGRVRAGSHGANAAGNIGRFVASLPAETTTTVPQRPMDARISYIVGSNSASYGV